MKKLALSLILIIIVVACNRQAGTKSSGAVLPAALVSGPFSDKELQQFASLAPIDAHTHVFFADPTFYAMLRKLNLRVLDIMLVDNTDDPIYVDLSKESKAAWKVVNNSNGHVILCTSFDPFKFQRRDFSQEANRKINQDFARGAVAVKFYKNVGMEIKDAKGNFLMPDNPIFEPIFKEIEAHDKTLITHLADPDTIWQAPNPAAPDYNYYMTFPKLYMYGKPGAPSKPTILRARDHILESNPKLRMVGAHLGSMESNFKELGEHLDKYPNFAVDLAARMPYVEMQPRSDLIAFITKYQDRLIYGTDNGFYKGQDSRKIVKQWEGSEANDWRFFATDDILLCRGHKVQGLALPKPILRKIYHDNAITWFPGILR